MPGNRGIARTGGPEGPAVTGRKPDGSALRVSRDLTVRLYGCRCDLTVRLYGYRRHSEVRRHLPRACPTDSTRPPGGRTSPSRNGPSPIGRDDQQVAGARRRDVGQAHAFGGVALIASARRGRAGRAGAQPASSIRAQPALGSRDAAPPRRRLSLQVDVGEDDDRKLEALGLVHGHQPHAVAAFFEDRRLRRLARRPLRRAARRRSRGTRGRPPPRSGAPARRCAARWRAPARRRARAEAGVGARRARAAGRSCRRPAGGCAGGAARAAASSASRDGAQLVPAASVRHAGTDGRRADRVVPASSASSPIANSGPRSVANTDSSSSGHSIAASAARIVSTSSRS